MSILSNKIKTLHVSFQEFCLLKDISQKHKRILLASIALITITGTWLMFFKSSNLQTHQLTKKIDQQNTPLAPSIEIATIQLPEKPVIKANPVKIRDSNEQIKEITSIQKDQNSTIKDNTVSSSKTTTPLSNSINKITNPLTKPQTNIISSQKEKIPDNNHIETSSSKDAKKEITQNKSSMISLNNQLNTNQSTIKESQLILPIPSLVTNSPKEISDKKIQNISKQEEISILNLLTKEATLIRDMKNEIISLKKHQQDIIDNNHDLEKKMSTAIEDLTRRISMQEANKAIAAASDISTTHESLTDSIPKQTVKVVSYEPTSNNISKKTSNIIHKKKITRNNKRINNDYIIQAASPDMAMLTSIDGKQLQVEINSDIPGYGHVKQIFQKGTAWYIITEKGVIQ